MGFAACHPAVNAVYFACMLAAALAVGHPVYLGVSLLCALAYAIKLGKRRAACWSAGLILCGMLFGLWYASYHHFGVTTLRKNFLGNNLTLESLVCGQALGLRIACGLILLSNLHQIFTADKTVYLFGRVSPRLSLFLAILLRMGPRVARQARRLNTAQAGIGRGVHQGGLFRRLRNGLRIGSMLITWTIEMLPGVSESMQSRGASLRGRTAFSIYRFDNRDRSYVVALFALMTLFGMGALLKQTFVRYSPVIRVAPVTHLSAAFYLGYAALCALPLGLDLWTEAQFSQARRRAFGSKAK